MCTPLDFLHYFSMGSAEASVMVEERLAKQDKTRLPSLGGDSDAALAIARTRCSTAELPYIAALTENEAYCKVKQGA